MYGYYIQCGIYVFLNYFPSKITVLRFGCHLLWRNKILLVYVLIRPDRYCFKCASVVSECVGEGVPKSIRNLLILASWEVWRALFREFIIDRTPEHTHHHNFVTKFSQNEIRPGPKSQST
jgi:hypothetical protein